MSAPHIAMRIYLSGEIKVGDMTVPLGVCIPIIFLPVVSHGEKGGTREA